MAEAPNVTPLRQAANAAAEVAPTIERRKADDSGGGGAGGGGGTRTEREGMAPKLPPGCGIVPLGKNGLTFHYLDGRGQLTSLMAKDHSRSNLQAMFDHRPGVLYQHWPRKNVEGVITGWRPELVGESLMVACSKLPIWDVMGKLRGRGGWLGDDGELVLHCGDQILRSEPPREPGSEGYTPVRALKYEPPGRYGRWVYPTASPVLRPSEKEQPGGVDGAGRRVMELLASWNFKRPIDSYLCFAWIGAALLGGAMPWRPIVWTTGDKGTGKSTLHVLLQRVIGEDVLLQAADSTQAGIYQTVRHQSLPVALDEVEASADNRRVEAVIKLARWAASGARMLRGGQDHQSIDFTIRSAFLFTSILIPPLSGQDRSRIAVLELSPLPKEREPKLDAREMEVLGRALRRRLVDQWPRMNDTLELYRDGLMARGHNHRSGTQWGTFLAIADLMLQDHAPAPDTVEQWCNQLAPEGLAENEEDRPDWERCVNHLRTSLVDVYRGGKRSSVIGMIREAAGLAPREGNEIVMTSEAADSLAMYGMKVHVGTGKRDEADKLVGGEAGRRYLAVANDHKGLQSVFQGTIWQAASGTIGVWVQSLRRVPAALASQQRIGGAPMRCTLVPLDAVISLEGLSAATAGMEL